MAVKHGTKGYLSSSSILVGISAGYAAASIMGLVLPTRALQRTEPNIPKHGY
ncbi:MAG: hypothetical protein ACLT76_05520 [Clostridium fessum]